MDIQQKIEALSNEINELARNQTTLSRRLIQLMDELELLKKQAGAASTSVRNNPGRKSWN